jgi:nicotinate-nucleotide adenylyltransferase
LSSAIGILGGTFDPIHFGHLRMAEELGESLALQQVRFLPAAQPPHRGEPQGLGQHRVAMAALAIADRPGFQLDLREFDRAGPSYMVDTLASLRVELGEHQPLCLLLGSDAFLGLPRWHCWRELLELAHIGIASRPGTWIEDNMPPELQAEWLQRRQAVLPDTPAGSIIQRDITALDISASDIRLRLQQKRSVRYLLPESVRDYIEQHHLYQKENDGT